ncbi:condensation domain-containing protein [Nonomuraea aurantiaca]|uniref:condensation domain-containing protein n=1 Tax=Nonomuraea aurantiaca TaxID=2878562 RepID=UPI001CD9F430|nr:condensation domain-containing protein [Nonomuraea aurantiaca]MCA2220984.1 condensation domain-containing protein [Nonomuraea aurantiaca]
MSAAKNANLCWGQRYMWLKYHRLPPGERHDTHIVLRLAIPHDVTVANCRAAINYLTRRHESLRTTYHLDPGPEPRQQVHPPAALPILLATTERDGTPAPAEIVERLGATAFRLDADWPIRACVITTGGVPKQIVLVLNHLAVDAWTVREIKRELTVQCAGFSSRRPAALEPVRNQPSDLARHESSAEATAVAARSLAYWGEEIARLPADPFAARRTPDREPVARSATLTSPSLLDAVRRIAATDQVWPSLVHVTAYTAMMAAYTGLGTVAHLSFSGNREPGPYAGVMTCMFAPMLVTVDCHDDPTFAQLLRRVAERFELARTHSSVPYDEVVELVSREGSRRGRPVRLGSEVNFIKQRSSEARARRTTFTWKPVPTAWAYEEMDTYFRIDEWRDAVVVGFHARSSVMGAGDMERFLRGYETVLLAGADIRISDVTRLADFSTPAPHSTPVRDRTSENAPEAEEALAEVVRQVNGLSEVDLSDSYTLAGGRALRIPRVLALLAAHGWAGASVHHLAGPQPLRALARKLTPEITPEAVIESPRHVLTQP